jgi:hypothetical protein
MNTMMPKKKICTMIMKKSNAVLVVNPLVVEGTMQMSAAVQEVVQVQEVVVQPLVRAEEKDLDLLEEDLVPIEEAESCLMAIHAEEHHSQVPSLED